MNSGRLTPWGAGDPVSARRLNEMQDRLDSVRSISGPGVRQGPDGVAIARLGQTAHPRESWVGIVVARGPHGEADYPTDARYWVRRADPDVVVAPDDPGADPDDPPFQPDLVQLKFTARPTTDPTAEWVVATNLAEVPTGTHTLAVNSPVLVSAVSEAGGVKRHFFTALALPVPQYVGDVLQAVAQNVLGAGPVQAVNYP